MRCKLFCAALCSCLLMGTSVKAQSADNLVKALSMESKISNEQAEQQIQSVFNLIAAELKAGRDVSIKRFGKFHIQHRAAHQARNPRTGASVQVPAKRYARFSSSEILKTSLNEQLASK